MLNSFFNFYLFELFESKIQIIQTNKLLTTSNNCNNFNFIIIVNINFVPIFFITN